MNNNHPTISIIVPVYNVEEYLPHCLKSIQNQTFTDYECILIDDGSTDSSGKICDDFCITDKRFKVIHQENQGQSIARNTGLKYAKGSYISFIDSDDIVHPDMLQVLHEAIKKNIGTNFSMVLLKRIDQIFSQFPKIGTDCQYVKMNQDELIRNLFSTANVDIQYQSTCNKLYTKEVIDGVYFHHTSSEDSLFNLKVYLKSETAVFIEKEMYYYVYRSTSTSHQSIGKHHINLPTSYHLMYQYIPKEKIEYRGYCLYKLYKRLLSIRYYAYPTEHKAYAKKIITEVRKDTWNDFLKNRSIKLSQKLIIMAFWHIPALYRAFMWYCEKQAPYTHK